jgi:hypothetical protein
LIVFAILVAMNPDKAKEILCAAWDMATWPFSRLMGW